ADARLDLKDELKSALWFAHREPSSAAEVLMLRHAAETVRGPAPRERFPLRVPGNFGAAAVLAAMVLGLAFAGRDTTHAAGSDVASVGDPKADARTALRARNTEQAAGFRFDAKAPPSALKAQRENELWARAEELAQSLKIAEERAEL